MPETQLNPAPLKVALIQAPLLWHDPEGNRAAFAPLVRQAGIDADFVLLPEMFTTGFTMQPQAVAEPFGPEAPTVQWLMQQAHQTRAVVAGSVAVEEDGMYFNRFIAAAPGKTLPSNQSSSEMEEFESELFVYDKRHLFTLAGENEHYTMGSDLIIFPIQTEEGCAPWRVMAQVCYDLRFPVWSRNVGDYDLCVYVANWPAKRAYAWKQLLIARAIENQAFVLGVNRVGMDGEDKNGHAYHGGSLIIGPDGHIIAEADDSPQTLTATLDYAMLTHLRETFPVIEDGDDFDLLD